MAHDVPDLPGLLEAVGAVSEGWLRITLWTGSEHQRIGGCYSDIDQARAAAANGANNRLRINLPVECGYAIGIDDDEVIAGPVCVQDASGRFVPATAILSEVKLPRPGQPALAPKQPGPRLRPSALSHPSERLRLELPTAMISL